MTDADALRTVARLLAEHAARCRTNGVLLPPPLALALQVASGGQGRPEMDHTGYPADARLMTLADAAGVLAVSERTARRLAGTGELPTVDVASCPRVRVADLVTYVTALPRRAA